MLVATMEWRPTPALRAGSFRRGAHGITRYEASLARNPFVLRTAPPAAVPAPRAADWTLASVYGESGRPTVAVVNVKTLQRVRLLPDGSSAGGMRLVRVELGSRRKDILAVVDFEGQQAELRFSAGWLRQAAAAKAQRKEPQARGPAGGPHPLPAASPDGRRYQHNDGAAGLVTDPAGTAAGRAPAQPGRAPLLLTAAGDYAPPGIQEPGAATAPEAAAAPDAPSDASVWLPLASTAPIPLRRHLLRPSLLTPRPDPQ